MMTHPRLYRLAGKLGGVGDRLTGFLKGSRLDPVQAWRKTRTLPSPAKQSFQDWWGQGGAASERSDPRPHGNAGPRQGCPGRRRPRRSFAARRMSGRPRSTGRSRRPTAAWQTMRGTAPGCRRSGAVVRRAGSPCSPSCRRTSRRRFFHVEHSRRRPRADQANRRRGGLGPRRQPQARH